MERWLIPNGVKMSKKCCKCECPPGPQGPKGLKGDPGVSPLLQSYFGQLETALPLPAGVATGVPLTPPLVIGTLVSPARFLEITATFAASTSAITPNTANVIDFVLRVDGDTPVGGSELTFTVANGGQSGAIVRRVPVTAGIHTVTLEATAQNTAGASIDPVGRPSQDHAAVLVLETSA